MLALASTSVHDLLFPNCGKHGIVTVRHKWDMWRAALLMNIYWKPVLAKCDTGGMFAISGACLGLEQSDVIL